MTKLGLHDEEKPTYLFVSNEQVGNEKHGWYRLVGGDTPQKEAVKTRALSGFVSDLKIQVAKVKAGKAIEEKEKLDLTIKAGDEIFVVRSGINTTFSKILALSLSKLTEREFQEVVKIVVTPSPDSDKVVFCSVKVNEKPVSVDWKTEWEPFKNLELVDFQKVVKKIQEKINFSSEESLEEIPQELLEEDFEEDFEEEVGEEIKKEAKEEIKKEAKEEIKKEATVSMDRGTYESLMKEKDLAVLQVNLIKYKGKMPEFFERKLLDKKKKMEEEHLRNKQGVLKGVR